MAAPQHGLVTYEQLRELGVCPDAIRHRVRTGRLYRVAHRLYVVGRPGLGRHGSLMAAVLACGAGAAASHGSAAGLWGITPWPEGKIDVTVPAGRRPRARGVTVHRSATLEADVTRHRGIPVTTPIRTLFDVAADLEAPALEAVINQADKLDLVHPEELREAVGDRPRHPGVARVRAVLDRRTFALTDSELERRFLPLAREAGLPRPETGCYVNGFKVDFYWPILGLVVETDGLRYHRTPAHQARDRVRDQVHTAAGLVPLRFTHAQVAFERDYVRATLAAVAGRLEH